MSEVEVHRGPDGRWRWRYREDHAMRPIFGHEDYADIDAAVAAARAAYPDADVRAADAQPATNPQERHAGKAARWLALLVVLVAWSRARH